mgnify:CR=1 FL=1
MKKTVKALLYILTVAMLSGCGGQTDPSSQPESGSKSVFEAESGLGSAQWTTKGFDPPGETESALWAGKYEPWNSSDSASSEAESIIHLDHGVCGELLWVLNQRLATGEAEDTYILEICDTTDMEYTVKQFTPEDIGLSGAPGYLLAGMDFIEQGQYVFRWQSYERSCEQDQDEIFCQTADQIIYTNLADEVYALDLQALYPEMELEQDEMTGFPRVQMMNFLCDGRGNIGIQIRKESDCAFYLFDQKGFLLLSHKGTGMQQMMKPLRTPNRELVLPVYDSSEKKYEFLWADTEAGEMRSIAVVEAPSPFITQIYGMLDHEVYYHYQAGTTNCIAGWNVKNGRGFQVLDLAAMGTDKRFQTLLALREGRPPVLMLRASGTEGNSGWLAPLTAQKPDQDMIVRVADLTERGYITSSETILNCTSLATLENPNFRYEYEDVSAQEDRDRIFAQLSQGQGPDLLFVSREDLYLLAEKGLLLNIEDFLSEELREKLLPGALELGTIDGQLMGMPASVNTEVLTISADTWTEDSWSLEDVVTLMENGRIKGALYTPYSMNSNYFAPPATVLYLLGTSYAGLIDWPAGKSHFNDDLFLRLLKVTQKDIHKAVSESESWFHDGTHIIPWQFNYESYYNEFFTHLEEEGGRMIGYPTEEGCGNYLITDGILAVNVNTANREAAACFLKTLLGERLQSEEMSNLSVLKKNPDDELVWDSSGNPIYCGQPMTVFEDGTTPLHRMEAFLESCTAAPRSSLQVDKILYEELMATYSDHRTPEDTADIIHRRVQLYLDEGN